MTSRKTSLLLFFRAFYYEPFETVDSIEFEIKGNNLNIFQKYKRLQKIGFWLAAVAGLCWILFGFDSAVGQIMHFIYAFPDFITGALTLQQWIQVFIDSYGTELHFSAVVLYGFMFYFLSRHYENKGIVKSRNIAYSIGLTLLSIGLFEFYWMISYATFQNQPWVMTWKFPQLRIIIQNLSFCIVGAFTLLYMSLEHLEGLYKLRTKFLAFLLVTTLFSSLVWIYYPIEVNKFTVTLDNGEVWRNTNNFPQTLYTIDLDPNDNVNAGVWFYQPNDMVHLLNTIVKVLFSLSIFYIGYIKRSSYEKKPEDYILIPVSN